MIEWTVIIEFYVPCPVLCALVKLFLAIIFRLSAVSSRWEKPFAFAYLFFPSAGSDGDREFWGYLGPFPPDSGLRSSLVLNIWPTDLLIRCNSSRQVRRSSSEGAQAAVLAVDSYVVQC